MSLRNLRVKVTTVKRGKWYVAHTTRHTTMGELFPDMGKPNPEIDEIMRLLFPNKYQLKESFHPNRKEN